MFTLAESKAEQSDFNFETQYHRVVGWGARTGIIQTADIKTQTLKFASEAGELCDAIAKDDYEAITDAIGDVLVTMIMICEIGKYDMVGCLHSVAGIIEKRKGKMVGGTFIKENSDGTV